MQEGRVRYYCLLLQLPSFQEFLSGARVVQDGGQVDHPCHTTAVQQEKVSERLLCIREVTKLHVGHTKVVIGGRESSVVPHSHLTGLYELTGLVQLEQDGAPCVQAWGEVWIPLQHVGVDLQSFRESG